MKNIIHKLSSDGMTQVEIAGVAGCSQATIAEILSGKNKNPSFVYAVKLAKECERRGIDWSIDDFLSD